MSDRNNRAVSTASVDRNELFSRQKIHFQPTASIFSVLARNNHLLLTLRNDAVLRIPLLNPSEQDEIPLSVAHGDRIVGCFLDPTGQHFFVSTEAGELCYLHQSMKKPKLISKARGHVITSIGWNHVYGREDDTGFILLGTSRGFVFESRLQCDEVAGKLVSVTYFKQVYSIVAEQATSISGIEFYTCSLQSTSPQKSCRFFLLISTASELHSFASNIPNPSTVSVDSDVTASFFLPESSGRVHNLPGSTNAASYLTVYFDSDMERATNFAWLACPGIMYGQLDTSQTDAFRIVQNHKLYKYPTMDGKVEVPKGLVASQFHMIMMFNDRLLAVSNLNEQIVYEDIIGSLFGKLGGISKDPATGIIWLFTDQTVLKYKPNDEDRYVWRILLERKQFNEARKLALKNPGNLDIVLKAHAKHLLAEKNVEQAADLFAMTTCPFEEVTISLIQSGGRIALKKYLTKKLDFATSEKTQTIMLVLWLIDIYLTEMVEAKTGLSKSTLLGGLGGASDIQGFDPHQYKVIRDQFKMFLNKKVVLDAVINNTDAVYKIMASHGDTDPLLYFARLMKDYDKLVNLYIQQENYDGALLSLVQQEDPITRRRLVYRFSPQLMNVLPVKLVEMLINLGPQLRPKLLLPALFEADKNEVQTQQALRYLEFCVERIPDNCDQAVHNFLLSLYVKFYPEKVLAYLTANSNDAEHLPYDPKYALRLCTEKKLQPVCVFLCALMGLYQEAVNLALQFDVDLAKDCARKVRDDDDLCKKLWLCIARHVVEHEQDIKKCMDLLQETNGLIRIQDILPFFPPFATIEHFKDPLCQCLAEHSDKIRTLQDEMKDATESAKAIKNQLKSAKTKSIVVKVRDRCSSCSEPLMIRQFYVFPCRHSFHIDCIEKEVVPFLSKNVQDRLTEVKRQLLHYKSKMGNGEASSSIGSHGSQTQNGQSIVDGLRNDLDDILGDQCVFCADYAIRLVDKPFFNSTADYNRELKNWE